MKKLDPNSQTFKREIRRKNLEIRDLLIELREDAKWGKFLDILKENIAYFKDALEVVRPENLIYLQAVINTYRDILDFSDNVTAITSNKR